MKKYFFDVLDKLSYTVNMPKKIDHEKRKIEIMYAALEVYAQEGKNANLSLIASKCGLSRTTIYQYFKDESELYHYAVKHTTDLAFDAFNSEKWQSITDPVEKLLKTTQSIMDMADTYEKQVGNFLKMIDKIDGLTDIIKHRTAKLNLYFSRLVRQAIKEERMKKCSAKGFADKLEVLLESYLFHMVYFPQNKTEIREIISDFINSNSLPKAK